MSADEVAVGLGSRLTPMQRGLLASQRRSPDSPHQNMALLSHLDGPVDVERLADAFGRVAARTDVLRTQFVEQGGVTVTRVAAEVPRRGPANGAPEIPEPAPGEVHDASGHHREEQTHDRHDKPAHGNS